MKYSIITSSYNQLEKLKRLAKKLKEIKYDNFEWIIADDGSNDGTVEFFANYALNPGDNELLVPKHVITQPHNGYGLVSILNKTAEYASGEYLLWIMSDTYPRHDFFEKLDQVVKPNRMVCGIRLNMDIKGLFVSPDWRVKAYPFDAQTNELQVISSKPWELMTLNGMCMSKESWDKMGGIPKEYKGYGQMDWFMAAWAFYNNYDLYWACQAFLNHDYHEDREDTPENIKLFQEHLDKLRKGVSINAKQ